MHYTFSAPTWRGKVPKHVVLGWPAKPEVSPRGEVMLGGRDGPVQVLPLLLFTVYSIVCL